MRFSTIILALTFILVTTAAESESLLTGGACSFATWANAFDCFDVINPLKLQGLALTKEALLV